MIGTLMAICILGMFLVGVLFPLGILIYMTVIFIKEKDWDKWIKISDLNLLIIFSVFSVFKILLSKYQNF